MLWPVSTRRFLALALALLLLITQHLGLQHVLGHALHGDGATAAHLQATPASDGMAAGAAVRATGKVTAEAASDLTDDAADGLCGICLVLATLGVAAVPALLQWRALLRAQAVRLATRLRQWSAPALASYLARAPPASC